MATNNNNFRRYTFLLPLLIPLLLGFTALVNYLIDPYGLFDVKRIEGVNALKPKATLRVRITKPYLVDRFNPDIIIAGNSRPEIGMDPQNVCWKNEGKSVFNLSLPGASVYMAARYIQHAIAANEIKQVFWGLDFKDFLYTETDRVSKVSWPPAREVFEERLKVNAKGEVNNKYYLRKIKDYLTVMFSLDALKASVGTMLVQSNKHAPTIRRDGFNPAKDFLDIIKLEGQGLVFKQKDIDVIDMFYNNKRVLPEDVSQSLPFESVRQLLEYARKNKVEPVLFINPYHSDYLQTINSSGLWDNFLQWKQQLVTLSNEYNVQLWDFSGFNTFSNPQPAMLGNKKDVLKWFWEPAHYRREYGDFLISKMLDRKCGEAGYSNAGDRLTVDNMLMQFDASNEQLRRYSIEYPAAIERLKSIESKTLH